VRRLARWTVLAVLILVATVAIAATPLVLVAITRHMSLSDSDWTHLGTIGQAYGAASAILLGASLLGVVIALRLQGREARVAREVNQRLLHMQLIQLALSDATLLDAWGEIAPGLPVSQRRQYLYTNLVFSHWELLWELGSINADALAKLAEDIFEGETARRFWSHARSFRGATLYTSLERQFHQVVDQQCTSAIRRASENASQREHIGEATDAGFR
jgi:hypothetical protein